VHLSRKEYLKEARKKYFFKDSSLPSFRLFEHEDDNGKYIEEVELWRPLGASSQHLDENEQDDDVLMQRESENNQNNQREVSKCGQKLNLAVQNNNNAQFQANTSYELCPAKTKSPAYKRTTSSDFEFSSIQCAQRQASYSIPQYKDREAATENEIEELINPDPSEPSKLLSNNKLPARWNIAGRKLFQDESEMTPISKIQKLKEPVSPPEVEFLCEKLKKMSPEVQFLGERSNRDVASSPEVQFLGERVFKISAMTW